MHALLPVLGYEKMNRIDGEPQLHIWRLEYFRLQDILPM